MSTGEWDDTVASDNRFQGDFVSLKIDFFSPIRLPFSLRNRFQDVR